jgi:hypothetical protein
MKTSLVRTAIATALAVPSIALLANIASAGRQDFMIRNMTDFTIVRLYVSSSSSSEWEEDVLHSDVLKPGRSMKLRFGEDTQDCIHDIKAVFNDGDAVERRGVDLCSTNSFTFR